jgi:hypothetical protein
MDNEKVGITFLKVVQYIAGVQPSREPGNVAYFPADEALGRQRNGMLLVRPREAQQSESGGGHLRVNL